MGDGSDVLDHGHFQAHGLQGADGGLTTLARTLHEDLNGLQAMLHGGLGGGLGKNRDTLTGQNHGTRQGVLLLEEVTVSLGGLEGVGRANDLKLRNRAEGSKVLNRLVGQKIAIVSRKPQTTRTRITGVLTEGEVQLVFIDTPGLHKPKNKLGDYMVKQVSDSVGDVDCAVLVTDPFGEIVDSERQLIENIKELHLPAILVINKIDTLANKEDMVKKMVALSEMYDFTEVVPISVKERDGTDLLLKLIQDQAQEGPHFFPSDTLTDQPEKVIAAEIIREKVLRNMRDEIPHGTAVVIERMRERQGKNMMDIDATILCEKASHKGMIIGKKGAMLKKIASESRQEIEAFLDSPVNLQCWVKVREDWRNNEFSIRDLGFN